MSTSDELHSSFSIFYKTTLAQIQDHHAAIDRTEISARIAKKQRELTESAGALAAYDVRQYQSKLDELSRLSVARQEEDKPKAKFAFKTKRVTPSSKPSTIPALQESTLVILAQEVLPEPPGSLTIHGRDSQLKHLNTSTHADLLHNSTITIESVEDCEIDLTRAAFYTSVTLRNLKRCSIIAGMCTSSLFIENCESCQITGEAQQFRIHTCLNCEVRYICRTGRPVIEACKSMQFGNLATVASIEKCPTMVDDFSDLSGSRRNWSVLAGFVSG